MTKWSIMFAVLWISIVAGASFGGAMIGGEIRELILQPCKESST